MKIDKITITNIRSFREETIFSLHKDFNIIIGPNGSGKSNLLDIITIVIRKYFLLGFQILEQNDQTGYYKQIQQYETFGDIRRQLANFFNCTSEKKVNISFCITSEDINNINKIKNNLTAIREEANKFRNSPMHWFDYINNWDTTKLVENEVVTYTIINDELSYDSSIVNNITFYQFLNCFEYIVLITSDNETLRLNPNYLFFGPYRSGDFQNLQATLSSQTFSQAFQAAVTATSRTNLSLINIASLYFAEKRRKFEDLALSEGYKVKWDNDPEVKLVTKYLNTIGYSWDLKLVDKNKNIYEIILFKDGKEFLISQASSGEKEILNFLLGIFAINMKNGTIIVDEPELHLHPRWQNTLMDLFLELARATNNQFIITTHSPIFINSKTYNHIFRVFKDKENASKNVELKDIDDLRVKDILHIVNSTNNEKIFFADKVILVEGVTDYLVFSSILNSLAGQRKGNQIIEIIEIKGKTNQDKFNKFLHAIGVQTYFIADLDFVHNIGGPTLKSLFVCNEKKVIEDVLKNPKSKDYESLVDVLDSSIRESNIDKLRELWQYIKSLRLKIKTPLSETENRSLTEFIAQKRKENVFILEKGDIERYFPVRFSAKDLDNVFSLLSEAHIASWKVTDDYKYLENIIIEINSN
jgi:predicted ATP-dependent endonuclease of OLD family